MRLVSFPGGFGRVEGDMVVPMGDDLVAYLGGEPARRGALRRFDGLRLLAPIPRPAKVVCIGLNYRDHAEETGQPIPDQPVVFGKWANSVIGPGYPIEVPSATAQVDYEAELGVVIGRRIRRVAVEQAMDYVAGYVCCNDVSARDLQQESSQWTRGKAIDTFLPMGPVLCTADELPDPQSLSIRCLVNGQERQASSTSQMIFGVAQLVAFLTQTMTLEVGDVISTGTPPGVGMASDPPTWLAAGDQVTVEIEGIGALVNPVVAAHC